MVGRIFQTQIPPVGRNDNFGIVRFADAEVVEGQNPSAAEAAIDFCAYARLKAAPFQSEAWVSFPQRLPLFLIWLGPCDECPCGHFWDSAIVGSWGTFQFSRNGKFPLLAKRREKWGTRDSANPTLSHRTRQGWGTRGVGSWWRMGKIFWEGAGLGRALFLLGRNG